MEEKVKLNQEVVLNVVLIQLKNLKMCCMMNTKVLKKI